MKKMMLALAVAVALVSCADHGKKVTLAGTKGEVYYKGDGVTESDANKLGNFLREQGYFDNKTTKTVQITKAKDAGYDVHFVVDEKKLKETAGAESNFEILGIAISKDVFDGQPVNICLSDDHLKDFKTLAYNKAKAEELLNPKTTPTETANVDPVEAAGYDHDTADGIKFFWKGMSDEESKTIADYIVKNGAFKGGSSELYMTKEDGRFIIRFPMIESARNDQSYIDEVGRVSKEIKDNVFANNPFTFVITDEKLETVKAFAY